MSRHKYEQVDVVGESPASAEAAPAKRGKEWGLVASLPLMCLTVLLLFYLVVIYPDYQGLALRPAWLTSLATDNLQARSNVHLGAAKNGYRLENKAKLRRRIRDMADLNKVRLDYCGDLEQGQWVRATWLEQYKDNDVKVESEVSYYNDSVNYAKAMSFMYQSVSNGGAGVDEETVKRLSNDSSFGRWLCEGAHPRLPDTKVRLERWGPFYGNGNYDWNSVSYVPDVFNFEKEMHGKTFYVVGRMFATVHANGSFITYPPLHTHHAHVYPKSSREIAKVLPVELARRYGIFDPNEHHVLIQAHGDTICKEEDGGLACLLDQLPDGQGYRVHNTDGFAANFEVNDVRPKGSPPLEFYCDVAVVYTMKRRVETTFMQIGSPPLGIGWNTYIMPMDPSSNVMFFNYTNFFLGDGELSDFVMHTHMSYFDSIYVFKGDKVYSKLNQLRIQWNSSLPIIFDCLPSTKGNPKKTILKEVLRVPGASLVCEGARPSMQLFCKSEHDCMYRDKRIQFNCLDKVRFGVNETLTVVAFNYIRNVSTTPITRNSSQEALAIASPFGAGYAAIQHSFFRANFVSERARTGTMGPSSGDAAKDIEAGNYAPAALFIYSALPFNTSGRLVDSKRVIAQCPASINFKVDLPWNAPGVNT